MQNGKRMKKTIRFWGILGMLALLAFAACKKDPVPPDPTPSTPETSVTFTCKDTLGIPNIYVGIAPQSADRDNGIFLQSGTSDNLGKIKFSGLDPQTMYYSASRTTSAGVVKRIGSVQIVKDAKKYVTVQY